MTNNKVIRRILPILLSIAMLLGISIVALAEGGTGGGNAGLQTNMAGTGFQIRLSDPDIQMSQEGGTYVLDGKFDPKKDIVFTFSLNPNGGQRGFGIYPSVNGRPAGFDGVVVYDKADADKKPVLALGGNYSEETMNPDFFFEESYDATYADHLVFNMASNAAFSNERSAKLTIKANELKPDKTYCLYFPKDIKTFNNTQEKQLGVDVTIEFKTDVDPEAPYFSPTTSTKLSSNNKYAYHNASRGYGTVAHPWNEGPIVMEVRVDPKGKLAGNYAEENYKQFSLASYYGEEIPVTVGPGRANNNYTFYRVDMDLVPGWYCLTIGKDFKNDSGKTIGDYYGDEDYTYWILMANYESSDTGYTIDEYVDLTTELQNITYADVSAANMGSKQGRVAMSITDTTCPDYLVKLTASEGYSLPSEVSITVNGKALEAEKDYTYTPETLQKAKDIDGGDHEYNLKVDRHAINGPVVITAAAVKPVTGVSLDKTELKLDERAAETLVATVSPEDAMNKNVAWTSSDEAVATVDKDGKVSVLKAGKATITATTEDGKKTATCEVTVNHVEEILPAKEPTCTEPGLTEGTKCSVCSEIIKTPEEIPALGHDWEVIPEVISTCTKTGSTAGARCTRCGEYLIEPKEVPMIRHDYDDHGICTVCGAKDPDYVEPQEPTSKTEEPTSSTTTTTKKNEEPSSSTTTTTQKNEEPSSSTTTTTKKNEEPSSSTTTTTKKAESAKKLNGLVKGPDGKWALYNDDSVQKSFTGLAKNENGWYYLKNGYVDWNYTGFAKNEKGWWRVENGKVNFQANSIYKQPSNGIWYKTTNGYITWDETGVFKNVNGWWRVENSRVNFYADGIYKNKNGWWKTTGGKVHFNETGIFKNENGNWYCKNSKVDFSKNGKVQYKGKTYTVTNGYAKLS